MVFEMFNSLPQHPSLTLCLIALLLYGYLRLRRQGRGHTLYAPTEEDIEKMEQIPDLKIFYPARHSERSEESYEILRSARGLPQDDSNQPVDDSEIMVVLLNMGGPKNISEVRGFLKRIFCDELIIQFPFSSLLQPIFANGLVALRGKETERRYGLIGGGSPILQSTMDQTKSVQRELNKRGRKCDVIFSFNYSNPFPDETISQIKSAGKKYILPLSLYPHFSAATTGSNVYYLKKAAARLYPELVFLKSQSYYLADSYIDAFVDRIKETLNESGVSLRGGTFLSDDEAIYSEKIASSRLKNVGTRNDTNNLDDFYLLFSAHGLPLYFLAQGDQYPFEIAQSVAKILDKLGRRHAWVISYQSAVGPMRWLKPSTEAMLKALARRGIKKLIVVPISFVTDHIETLCEIDIEYRALAEGLGIKDFRMSKALESHPGFINALADCVEESLGSIKRKETCQC